MFLTYSFLHDIGLYKRYTITDAGVFEYDLPNYKNLCTGAKVDVDITFIRRDIGTKEGNWIS